jgi:hypothetical protein
VILSDSPAERFFVDVPGHGNIFNGEAIGFKDRDLIGVCPPGPRSGNDFG